MSCRGFNQHRTQCERKPTTVLTTQQFRHDDAGAWPQSTYKDCNTRTHHCFSTATLVQPRNGTYTSKLQAANPPYGPQEPHMHCHQTEKHATKTTRRCPPQLRAPYQTQALVGCTVSACASFLPVVKRVKLWDSPSSSAFCALGGSQAIGLAGHCLVAHMQLDHQQQSRPRMATLHCCIAPPAEAVPPRSHKTRYQLLYTCVCESKKRHMQWMVPNAGVFMQYVHQIHQIKPSSLRLQCGMLEHSPCCEQAGSKQQQ